MGKVKTQNHRNSFSRAIPSTSLAICWHFYSRFPALLGVFESYEFMQPAHNQCSRRESNPDQRFRKPLFYPLNYGNCYSRGTYAYLERQNSQKCYQKCYFVHGNPPMFAHVLACRNRSNYLTLNACPWNGSWNIISNKVLPLVTVFVYL